MTSIWDDHKLLYHEVCILKGGHLQLKGEFSKDQIIRERRLTFAMGADRTMTMNKYKFWKTALQTKLTED